MRLPLTLRLCSALTLWHLEVATHKVAQHSKVPWQPCPLHHCGNSTSQQQVCHGLITHMPVTGNVLRLYRKLHSRCICCAEQEDDGVCHHR